MNFKSKMKKTEQDDALLEAKGNPVFSEYSEEYSENRHIVVNPDNMKIIADFIEKFDKLASPDFKIKAEYIPSEEFRSVITSFSKSAEVVAGEMKKYYDSIPERVFEKIRYQILEDVKKSQGNQRTELWLWRILYAVFGLVGVVWSVLELMGRYRVESPMEVLLLIFTFMGWTYLFYKIGGWMKG